MDVKLDDQATLCIPSSIYAYIINLPTIALLTYSYMPKATHGYSVWQHLKQSQQTIKSQ